MAMPASPCPGISRMVRISQLACVRWLAELCRNVWQATLFGTRDFLTALRRAACRAGQFLRSALPLSVRANGMSPRHSRHADRVHASPRPAQPVPEDPNSAIWVSLGRGPSFPFRHERSIHPPQHSDSGLSGSGIQAAAVRTHTITESPIPLRHSDGPLVKIIQQNKIAGVAGFDDCQKSEYGKINWRHNDALVAVVHRLAVRPVFQGKGFAGKLMGSVENTISEKGFGIDSSRCMQRKFNGVGVLYKMGVPRGWRNIFSLA